MEPLIQIIVLMLFILLMLFLNLKTGSARHWTSQLLKVASFWLTVVALGVLVWKLWAVVL